ncbi:hypothetical protein [Mycobacterium sp. URHB0044]|jgi:hypothetical protein|uniref:hypothetical protein n=1 Tax=Mycobacterium sp. URHB0044 TaxID=1380386 RepID=UPI000491E7EA|nr:hypothetical protein [Mycobacterium sp. URHB0044]
MLYADELTFDHAKAAAADGCGQEESWWPFDSTLTDPALAGRSAAEKVLNRLYGNHFGFLTSGRTRCDERDGFDHGEKVMA